MGFEHVITQLVSRVVERVAAAGPSGAVDLPVDIPIQGTGQETRAFVYIDDLVDGLLRVIADGKHLDVYHIGNDRETTIA